MKSSLQVVARVAGQYRATHKVIEVDGVRVLFDGGWGLLRASNTQPVLVMRFEAAEQNLLETYQSQMESVLNQAKEKISDPEGRPPIRPSVTIRE